MSLNQGGKHYLFLVNNYPPKTGGVENHVYNLAKSLVKLGHHCTVICLSKDPSYSCEEEVKVFRIRQGIGLREVISFPTLRSLKQIKSIVIDSNPTIISTHTRFFPMTWIGVYLGKKYNIPVVHTEHGSGFVRGVGLFVGLLSRLVDVSFGKFSLRNSRLVLSVSEGVAEFVYKLARVQSSIFYNAVNIPTRHSKQISPGESLNSKFVFVGRLVPGKGADKAVMATSLLHQQGIDVSLEILGNGAEMKKLQMMAENFGISRKTIFRGKVSQQVVMETLADSVLLNPTELSEGFQTTLLEAVVAGAQVITYNAPGVEKLVSQGAPITVLSGHSVETLAHAMKQVSYFPLPKIEPTSLDFWSWDYRAKEYEELTSLSA